MTARFDAVAFGELVADLIPAGHDGDEPLFAARPGGAPGNVAAGLARLGLRTAMLSKVGREPFGDLVVNALSACGVETAAIRRAQTETTALAAVSVNAAGERDFTLYRAGCADARYAPEEVDTDVIRDARLLHVGSLSLGTPVSAAAQRLAVATARDAGAFVSADPNLRPSVWHDPDAMVAAGREAAASADIVKVSEEELTILSGENAEADAVRRLWHSGLKVLAVTKGPSGADIYTGDWMVQVHGFTVDVVDTVGCGDAFMASLLAGLLATDLSRLDRVTVTAIGRRATAAGAVMATKAGAMTRMPRQEEIDALIAMRHLEAT